MLRYSRNKNLMSDDEIILLSQKKVCVLGLGGLGGYIVEMLSRIGVGSLTLVDGDVFDETNLNRQLFSSMNNLGSSKALEAEKRVKGINPLTKVIPVYEFVDSSNAMKIIANHDVIVDALDSIDLRKYIAKVCTELNLPLVHGAIAGWYGQVATIYPNDTTLDILYPKDIKRGIEKELGNPSFTPALVASIQVSEVIKLLLNRGDLLRNSFMMIDLYTNDIEVIKTK
ncbi:Molybdopterin or thiamine biosynthesis adenylyltransferase [Acetoanaerobium noterae]|uniref:Molybdopterin or thiamine biosynthesis adenylyltransferase n=1 Tax=Acetoanaerobium noterae TaxID=745369 RepID=A0A1T5BBW8_9FIRM|nr:HesA/MoeB/ThiF family protein [Acetoanaerobium noterae]MBP8762575.1 HesA/MoeB/ThiF family protein [Acetoanaerobium sp.]SKB44794.1 Molybdopterin or thiamine biosynthesis adenylyltransferase [Acetoanaerobium noterae]